MTFLIVRDQRTGGEYTTEAAAQDIQEYSYYANEAADIEVEIRAGPYYKGSGESDDPSEIDVSGGAKVCEDVRFYDPVSRQPVLDKFVFRAGQIIELTDRELEQAEEQAFYEMRASAEPEYDPE